MFGSQLFAWLLLQVVFLLWHREAARAAEAWWAPPQRHPWWERECKHETCLQNILHFFYEMAKLKSNEFVESEYRSH